MSPHTITVIVPSAGSPVQLSAVPTRCNTISITAAFTNSGLIYPGAATLNKSTGANMITNRLAKDTSFLLASQGDENVFDLSDYWIDADVSGDKVQVCYWPI